MTGYWSVDDMVRYADSASKPGRLQHIIANTYKVFDHRLSGEEEEALIITDTEVSPVVVQTVAGVLRSMGVEPTVATMGILDMPNMEPPAAIAEAATTTDLLVNMCVYSITHTRAIEHARMDHDVDYVLLADPTEDMFSRGMMTADPDEVDALTTKVAHVLQVGEDVRVTSEAGTDVSFSLAGRDQLVGRFPLGETPTCPVEETVEGTIVTDSFMMGVGIVEEPIVWEVEDGRIREISGGREARRLRQVVERHGDENAHWIGEFSVMTQPEARPNGNYIEAKQVAGGVHFALGDGADLGGKYESSIHLDGIQLTPTVVVDGTTLVEDGVIQDAALPALDEVSDDMTMG